MVPTRASSGSGTQIIEIAVPTITVIIAYGSFLLIIGRISINATEIPHNNGLMLKYLNWLVKIRMAIPFVKPTITGFGIRRIYFPSFNRPIIISKIPARTIEPTNPSMPYLSTMETSTTVIAPVGPEICALVPPNMEVIIPVQIAPYTPAAAPAPESTPKLSASGRATNATEIPPMMSPFRVDRISFCTNVFTFPNSVRFLLLNFNMLSLYKNLVCQPQANSYLLYYCLQGISSIFCVFHNFLS